MAKQVTQWSEVFDLKVINVHQKFTGKVVVFFEQDKYMCFEGNNLIMIPSDQNGEPDLPSGK